MAAAPPGSHGEIAATVVQTITDKYAHELEQAVWSLWQVQQMRKDREEARKVQPPPLHQQHYGKGKGRGKSPATPMSPSTMKTTSCSSGAACRQPAQVPWRLASVPAAAAVLAASSRTGGRDPNAAAKSSFAWAVAAAALAAAAGGVAARRLAAW
mmetsp:Transcript_51538/g.131018  ORF Transcript_51538/g.131018 Transcript_51538/m.131018 type:complete len:155 (-) Transcript_51538:116-580(-)